MKDRDYGNLHELVWMGGGWLPHNQNAHDLADQCVKGSVITFKEVTERDLSFHRCYMSLLSEIYSYLPGNFKKAVPKNNFYQFVKHLQGKYKVLFQFQDGTKMVEYESIAFGKMSQERFKNYIREQLPFIYSEIIGKFFEGEIYNNIIDNIETEYERFMQRL